MTERLQINRIGHRADGIADTPAGAVYVPYALPGETVDVGISAEQIERRELIRVESASDQRVAPICPHFGDCGGCATQHWSLAPYLAWKRELVAEALRQAELDTEIDDTIDAHGEGRRRVTLHARHGQAGFMAARAHRLVPITQCPILAPSLAGALPLARSIAQTFQDGKPLDIQITATDTGLDVDVRGSGTLKAAQAGAMALIAGRHHVARLTRHGEMVAQSTAPVLTVGRARVALPPGAFLQATVAGEETLARLVLAHAGKAKRVADLFAGSGTFALRLAETARVTAADSDAGAMDAVTRARASAPGLKAIDTQARDLFRRPLLAQELKTIDAVVFDPPRQGAEAQAREIAQSKVPLAIAVSCSAATFARDARILVDGGFRLTRVTPVDQFRYSAHVELVGKFERT